MENLVEREIPLFPISTTARILDISVHTLRMYEKEGLIIPFKKKSSHRLYSRADIDRLVCIRKSINQSKISINGIKTLYSLIPCWEITNCSEADRENCESYTSHSHPCWTFKHIDNQCSELICRECAVYKNFTECGTIKGKLKELIK